MHQWVKVHTKQDKKTSSVNIWQTKVCKTQSMISIDNSTPLIQTLEICIAVPFPCTSLGSEASSACERRTHTLTQHFSCVNKQMHPSRSVFRSGHRRSPCTWELAGIWTRRRFSSSVKISWSLFCLSHTQMVHWFNYTSVLSHTDTRAAPDHAKNKLIWEQGLGFGEFLCLSTPAVLLQQLGFLFVFIADLKCEHRSVQLP